MNPFSIYNRVMPYFRGKRLQQFLAIFHPDITTTILDVGGYPTSWSVESCPARMTFVNLDCPPGIEKRLAPQHLMVQGDGCALPFVSGSFDIVYSNSVIEHLGTFENQQRFAAEVRRVGKRLWVQTPARSFIVEPHLLAPFIHYLPKRMQRPLLRHFTIWGWSYKPDRALVDKALAELRLLTYREMKALFPDCIIYRERFLGMTKSFIAVR